MKQIAGLVLLAMALATVSCKKDSNDGDINQSDFYAEVIINGDTINMGERFNGYTNAPGSGGGVVDTAGGYLFRQFTQFAGANDTLRIYFIKKFAANPDAATKEAVIQTGSYPTGFGTFETIAPDANIKDGAAIVYIDGNGTRWTTDRDPEEQPNWNFTVTNHAANTFDGFSKKLTDVTFNARLHNPLNGNKIDISVIKLRARTIAP